MSWQRKLSINNNKQFILYQLLWIGISFGISLAISLLLPFPVSSCNIRCIHFAKYVYEEDNAEKNE